MSTIAIFGATGRTGLLLVRKALDAGHTVRALARTPQKFPFRHPNLIVIQGSSLEAAKVDETVEWANGVISVLGHDRASPPDLQTRSTQFMMDAMKHWGTHRLISLTTGEVRDALRDRPKFLETMILTVRKLLAGTDLPNALPDAINQATLIRKTDLDWTIVRGPLLTNDPPTGRYQVGYVGTVAGSELSRADLASFLLTEFEQGTHIRNMPFVTNG